ncbi:hypothetical protein [Bradyrhizobium sp. ERR14]|uniref:hypothetical protein n=1 Tax=Bradyrhizobium sp. ERR14 TaxID=2663837 RepID=UPI001617E978|nr:hypothetical protein [Bradyrhizobium sp. ERR14]MBB4391785.1 hypothetical protein [Bradyrhizobium sp. ERR14]
MFTPANCTSVHNLPGAFFSNPVAYIESALERRQYEAAVQTFAKDASPAGISASIASARRYGFKMTRVEAREAAVDGLRETLSALGYDETEIRWHAARRGRRDFSLFGLDERSSAARWEVRRMRRIH